MRKKRWFGITIFIFLAILPICSAAFTFSNHTIQKNYLAGDTIQGNFKISFQNEPAHNIFSSNLGGNITLIDMLNANNFVEGEDYTCNTPGCLPSYSPGSSMSTLALSNKSVVGLIIKDSVINSVEDAQFTIESDTAPSCSSQIAVKVLDSTLVNNAYTNQTCFTKGYGCFNSSASEANEEVPLGTQPYCEKITLPQGPAFRIGARINSLRGNGKELDMDIRDIDDPESVLATCTLPMPGIKIQDLECDAEYPLAQQKAMYVCISAPQTTNYTLRYEKQGSTCGTANLGASESIRDFEIFARPLQFGPVYIEAPQELVHEISDYIDSQYGNSCKPSCVVPISISGLPQTIQFKNVGLTYEESDGVPATSDSIVSVSMKDATVSAGTLDIDLAKAGIQAPSAPVGVLKITLGDKSVFDAGINVTVGFGFDISPRFVLIGVLTSFNASSHENIVSSTWDFGDGSSTSVSGTQTFHSYTSPGDYTVKVTLTRSDGKTSSKNIKVVVGNGKASAERLSTQYSTRLGNLSSMIQRYPSWIQNSLESTVDKTTLEQSLKEIKDSMNDTLDEDEYVTIVEDLLALDVPYAIITTKSGTLPITVGSSALDTSYADALSSTRVDDADKLKEAILRWMTNNYKSDATFEEISSFADSGKSTLLTKFRIVITPLGEEDESHLFINYPLEEITFMKDYGQESAGDGAATAIPLSTGVQDIEFAIPNSVSVADLGAYMSPDFSKLVIEEDVPVFDTIKESFKTQGFIFWISVLIISFLIVYIILQEWYKRHYERHLFASPDDLYNIINFIYNSRSSEMKDEDIRKKLIGSGWKREQITYAFKKIAGKRTGMFEIPIFKFFENRKVRQELQRRQDSPLDTRFIKRPNL
ncbi:PKD domain-containing protein [Candidatus Pacearchaeota archaeon]|nr:PKD domain-containing protein [Candidatus Pacearchaeota archaeon]